MEPVVVQTEPLIAEEREEDSAEVPEENAELPVKKKTRRRRRKKKPVTDAEVAEAGDEEPVEAEKAIDSIAEIEEADIPAADETVDALPKKTKRRRRKKKPTSQADALNGAEPAPLAEAVIEPIVVAEPATALADGEEVPAVKKKRRRRRSNGKKKPAEDETEAEDGPENSD